MNKTINILIIILLFGCQEMPSKKTPIHLNPNMDSQERFDPQEKQYFYDTTVAKKRNPVEGTIPPGYLKDDNVEYYTGKDSNGNFVPKVSDVLDVNSELINRGQERFNIYCTVCHGYDGGGNGLVPQNNEYNYPVTSLHSEILAGKEDGYYFDVITNGKNENKFNTKNMPSYAHQINPRDRWAIVAYIKALQISGEEK